ncbi:MAG: hypothetical protein ACR2PI_22980 [Hyphomicrobiaceae bacterium]
MCSFGFVAARDGGPPAVLRAACGGPRAGRFLQVVNVIGIGLLVSACASSHAAYNDYSHVGAHVGTPRSAQVAVATPPPVELEDDGLAVQAPPRLQKNPEPDDPSEPFSPNYGPAPDGVTAPRAPATMPIEGQRRARKRPVIIRSRTTPMSPAEVQAIMVQAMVAHERRNP